MIDGHGNDLHNYSGTILYDFSSNIAYQGMHPKLKECIIESVSTIEQYPEPDAESLKRAIAKHHNISSNMVMLNNGSTETFYLLAQSFTGFTSSIITPSFAEYEDACKAFHHSITFLPNDSLHKETIFTTKLVWIGNPNNPDGKYFSVEVIEMWCKQNPNTVFIIDEAYLLLMKINSEGDAKYCVSTDELLKTYTNIVVVHSLTKAFAIPGIRLGYMLAHPSILQNIVTIPWRINSLAITAGLCIMENFQSFLPNSVTLHKNTISLQNEIDTIDCFNVIKSNCNFCLVKMTKGKSIQLKQYLIEKHGILIRDASNFRGLDSSCFRVATQSDEINQLLLSALKQWSNI